VARRAPLLRNPAVAALAARWCARYRIARPVQLRSSEECSYAFTLGTLRPVVFVPAALLQQLSEADLDALLGHELAHVRRCDDFWFLVIRAVHILFFFTPIAWVASRALARLREQCCDAMAVRAGRLAPRQYLGSLLRVLELQAQAPPPPGLSFVTRDSSLQQRAKRLLAQPAGPQRRYWLLALILVLAAIVLSTPRYDAQLMPEAEARALFGAIQLLPPLPGGRLTRHFSGSSPTVACRLPNLRELNHPALDFVPGASRRVQAALGGEVIASADSGSPMIRKIVHIRHDSGLVATYAHVDTVLVKRGDRVEMGQPIAHMPPSGDGYLHFELHYRNQIVNPGYFLR
jgi:hypothetical protein